MKCPPICRLCESPAEKTYVTFSSLYSCSNPLCNLVDARLTESQWCKLMSVPERMVGPTFNVAETSFCAGYNAAIEDMEKGGEL